MKKPSGNLVFTPEAAEFRFPTVVELLAKGGKTQHVELGRLLAAIRLFYTKKGYVPARFQSASNAPVPVEILALAVKALAGRGELAASNSAEYGKAAQGRHAQIRREAEKIREKFSRIADNHDALAKKLRADPAMRSILTIMYKGEMKLMAIGTIAKIIARPEK
jgi:hypothetical protein